MAVKTGNRWQTGLAIALSSLAGYVDALGYLDLHGYFVSFMSGNSTQLGIALVPHASRDPAIAGFVIGSFVIGVIAGELVWRAADRHRRPMVLGFEALCLVAASGFQMAGGTLPAAGCMALAMGAENNTFQRDGQVSVGLTYTTSALVRMGQSLVAAVSGGPRFGWLPDLLLWAALVAGAVAGAASYRAIGLAALWIAAVYAGALALAARRVD